MRLPFLILSQYHVWEPTLQVIITTIFQNCFYTKLPMQPSTLDCLKHNEKNDSGGCQLGLA